MKGPTRLQVRDDDRSVEMAPVNSGACLREQPEALGDDPVHHALGQVGRHQVAHPKVRYQIAPDPLRHLMTAYLPKRMTDKIIAKRLGLLPQAND